LESVSSYGHSPLICMEAIGATKVKEFPDLLLSPGSLTIPMKHYLFELNRTGDRIHVFWVVWEKRNQGVSPEELAELNYSTQLIQLAKGRRDFSRKVVLLSTYGIESEARSREIVTELLNQWIQPVATN
jgi:hypothetical protein